MTITSYPPVPCNAPTHRKPMASPRTQSPLESTDRRVAARRRLSSKPPSSSSRPSWCCLRPTWSRRDGHADYFRADKACPWANAVRFGARVGPAPVVPGIADVGRRPMQQVRAADRRSAAASMVIGDRPAYWARQGGLVKLVERLLRGIHMVGRPMLAAPLRTKAVRVGLRWFGVIRQDG